MIYEWDETKRRETWEERSIDFADMDYFEWDTAIHRRSDRLPFTEYAQAALVKAAQQRGHPDAPKLSFAELAATALTFDEVAAQYGEETAVNVIIARDPDAPEWTPEDFAQAQPTAEVIPHILERWRRAGTPTK